MPDNDGRNLEAAAEAIETLLLQHQPKIKDRKISIKSRKRERINGVLHEFDVWISVDELGVFLVECKDWKDPVGKNEIIVFAEKLRATGAVEGYVVAREFTRDARAQAALSNNLRLQKMNQELTSLSDLPHFHEVFNTVVEDESIPVFNFGGEGSEFPPLDSEIIHNGEPISLVEARRRFIVKAVEEKSSTEPTAHMTDGTTYRLSHSAAFKMDTNELSIGGEDVVSVHVRAVFDVEVAHPDIFWHYNFIGRGVSVQYRREHPLATMETTFTRRTDTGESRTGLITTFIPNAGAST